MRAHLLRIAILLITFALGVGLVMTGRYIERGGVERADLPEQKPFVLVVKKRVISSESINTCH